MDYCIKDHLGNVRMVLTDERKTDVYPAATLEGNISNSTSAAYVESQYYNINSANIVNRSAASGIDNYENNNAIPNNNPNSNSTALSQQLYRLNSGTSKIGLGMTLKVMAGDKLNIYGKSYYFYNGSIPAKDPLPIGVLLDMFVGSASLQGKGLTSGQLTSGVSGLSGALDGFMNNDRSSTTRPQAYINWIFFDEQFRYAGGGFDAVSENNLTLKTHNIPAINVPKNGYVFVYCSNETAIDVFFDNLQVVHTRGALLEESHYYPFGLTMAEISSKAMKPGSADNKIKFQGQELASNEFSDGSGLEMYEFKWRMDDPQTGRFWQIDPLAEKYVYNSTYAFSENKVTGHIELEGLEAVNAISDAQYREMAARIGVNFSNATTNGMVSSPLITQRQIAKLEKGASADEKAGVILHRTVSSSAGSTLNSFESRGVGTHFLVGTDGVIYQTASLDQKTSHLRESQLNNDNLSNANTIGIEVVGNYNAETKEWDAVTTEQAKSVAFLVNSLITTYGLTNDNIYNHEDIQPKTAGEGSTVYNAIRQYLNRRNNADQRNANQNATNTTNQQRGF